MRFLTVSFDYELAWGTYEMVAPRYLVENVMHENEAAERVFHMNEELRIPAAWGMVGAAMDPSPLASRIEQCAALGAPVSTLAEFLSDLPPEQTARMTQIPLRFHERLHASSQEAAGHSYSHSYPETLTRSRLADDFLALRSSLDIHGHTQPMVYIAPKNRVTPDARELAKSFGFCSVRENPPTFLYDPPSAWTSGLRRQLIRVGRYADGLFSVNELTSRLGSQALSHSTDTAITGNFFFRPNLADSILGRRHVARLRCFAEARFSADQHVHVWTHPHNFGNRLRTTTGFYEGAMSMLLELAGRHSAPVIAPSEAACREP